MGHREWNPKSFFRHLTQEVLEALLAWSEFDLELDGEGALWEQIYRGWMALPDDERNARESLLLPVNDMCSPHARSYLEALATAMWTNGDSHKIEESRGWSVNDLAVRLFLENGAGFAQAHQNYAIDQMNHFTEYRGRHPAKVTASPAAKAAMKAAMKGHFQGTPFSTRCKVEDFANDEKLALFVFHEDESTPSEQFVSEDEIEPIWRRPVVRLAAVFHFETHTLLVKAARKEEREKLRDLFAQLFVGEPDYFEDVMKSPRFCFDRLRDPDFDFPTPGEHHIEEVSLVRLTASSQHAHVKRVTIEIKPGLSVEGVREVLAEHGLDLATDEIFGVRLQFRFEGKGRQRFRTVSLFNPSSTNLCDTERDRIIRKNLKSWGIDVSVDSLAADQPENLDAADLEAAAI